MYDEMLLAIQEFTTRHSLTDTVRTLCNIMLDISQEIPDDILWYELEFMVACNDRFDLEE